MLLLAANANINCQNEVSYSYNVCNIVHANVMIGEISVTSGSCDSTLLPTILGGAILLMVLQW